MESLPPVLFFFLGSTGAWSQAIVDLVWPHLLIAFSSNFFYFVFVFFSFDLLGFFLFNWERFFQRAISSRACLSSNVGSTSIPDKVSSCGILCLNFSLINLNRSLTDRLFTWNLAVLQVLRYFNISSQVLPLSTVLSLNLYGWQMSISQQRRTSCSFFQSMLANPVNEEKADMTVSLICYS